MNGIHPSHSRADGQAPPSVLVWEGFDRSQAVGAAFEVHEAAMQRGFMPDEATALSMVVARLGAVVTAASRAVVTVFFTPTVWRVELARPDAMDLGTPDLSVELLHGHSSMRVEKRGASHVLVVDYARAG
jgi:hypothetical protein